jgi:hypothetical protein
MAVWVVHSSTAESMFIIEYQANNFCHLDVHVLFHCSCTYPMVGGVVMCGGVAGLAAITHPRLLAQLLFDWQWVWCQTWL